MKTSVESATQAVTPDSGKADGTKSGALAVAGVAGALASACCIGPVVLVSAGLGSIAAGVVAAFEPVRPVFIVIAFAALGFGWWGIYRRPVAGCEPGTACAVPQTNRSYRMAFWIVAAVVLALIAFPYYVALLH